MVDTGKILKAVNDKLKELFPKTKIYGIETKEGYKTPCFNTEIKILSYSSVNAHITMTRVEITIDYLMTTVDTVEQLKVLDVIKNNFYKYLKVGDRVLHVADVSQGYTGDYDDVLTFDIDIDIYENTYIKIIDKPIEKVDLRLKRKDDIYN